MDTNEIEKTIEAFKKSKYWNMYSTDEIITEAFLAGCNYTADLLEKRFEAIDEERQKNVDSISVTIKDIISEQLGIPDSDLQDEDLIIADLGADSLDLIQLVMAIEEELGVEIDDSSICKVETVKDLINYVVREAGN